MALPDLTDEYIGDTYRGLLQTGNIPIDTTDKVQVYDGLGNPLPLKISKDLVEISNITYPLSTNTDGVLYKDENNTINILETIPLNTLETVIDGGTYNNVTSITINDQGIVTDIVGDAQESSSLNETNTVRTTTYLTYPIYKYVTMQSAAGYPYNKTQEIDFINLPATTKYVIGFMSPLSAAGDYMVSPYNMKAGVFSDDPATYFPILNQNIEGDPIGLQFISKVKMTGTTAKFIIIDDSGINKKYTLVVTLLGYQE